MLLFSFDLIPSRFAHAIVIYINSKFRVIPRATMRDELLDEIKGLLLRHYRRLPGILPLYY